MAAALAVYPALGSTTHSVPNPDSRAYSNLSASTIDILIRVAFEQNHIVGDRLFSEGEQPDGVYVVHSGKVKLSATSADGKGLIIRFAQAGDWLGLSAVTNDKPHRTNAEVSVDAQVSFIRRADLLKMMKQYGDLCLKLAQELGVEYANLCEGVAALGLGRCAQARLARLFLGWVTPLNPTGNKLQLQCVLTHEEMSQMIGTSRETVTRLLHALRDQHIAHIRQNTLYIENLQALAALRG